MLVQVEIQDAKCLESPRLGQLVADKLEGGLDVDPLTYPRD
jgi:hypothetical protein